MDKIIVDQALTSYLSRELDPAYARRARILVHELDIRPKQKILEVGCGRGFYQECLGQLYPTARITGLDRSPKYLRQAREVVTTPNVTLVKGDALSLPFESETFDRVFATEVLEHIPNHSKALAEMYRVVKPGGRIVVTVPHANYPFLWDPLNWILEHSLGIHAPSRIWFIAGIWADHVRLYHESELWKLFHSQGLTIQKIYRATRYSVPAAHFLLYGIGKNIVELGLFKEANRFSSVTTPPGALFQLLRRFLYSIDGYNADSEPMDTPTVNLILVASKPK